MLGGAWWRLVALGGGGVGGCWVVLVVVFGAGAWCLVLGGWLRAWVVRWGEVVG